jgi:hypothetical protein
MHGKPRFHWNKVHNPKQGMKFKQGILMGYETRFWIQSEGQISSIPCLCPSKNFEECEQVSITPCAFEVSSSCVSFHVWCMRFVLQFCCWMWILINVRILLSSVSCYKGEEHNECSIRMWNGLPLKYAKLK